MTANGGPTRVVGAEGSLEVARVECLVELRGENPFLLNFVKALRAHSKHYLRLSRRSVSERVVPKDIREKHCCAAVGEDPELCAPVC